MTNEQREAVETMQHWIEYEKEHKNEINKADELIHIQEIVLSLIKEQQEKIAKYEKIYKEYDCYRWVKELDKKDKIIEFYKKGLEREIEENRENVMEIIEKDKEIDKLKKQIDLMAEKINEAYFEENDFYDWFEKTFGIIPKGNYEEKIKQHFETKVKEKGE